MGESPWKFESSRPHHSDMSDSLKAVTAWADARKGAASRHSRGRPSQLQSETIAITMSGAWHDSATSFVSLALQRPASPAMRAIDCWAFVSTK